MSSRINPYTPGQFFVNPIHPPDPVLAGDVVYIIPAGYPLELICMSWQITTDANVADRIISFHVEDAAANAYFRSQLQDFQTAGSTRLYSIAAGYCIAKATAGIYPAALSWPVGLIVPGGYRYAIRVANIQAGDAISNIYGITHQFYST